MGMARGPSRIPFRIPTGFGGSGARLGGGRGGMGLIGIVVIVVLIWIFGGDPSILFQNMGGGDPATYAPQSAPTAEEQELADFVSVVLADTEDTWHELFVMDGRTYREPVLVLFSGAVESACGFAQAAVGPFYCARDEKVYIDLGFYQDLKTRFKAPGDFAQAYVIAHEIGHHVQNLLGILPKFHEARQGMSEEEGNALSVRVELQADCLSGVWANHAQRTRQLLEEGDIEEGLNAASAIGDDRLQRQSKGYVSPDSFTHGSSEQRVRWFKQGLEQGDLRSCDTFSTDSL
jgi:predicted metalloprotease